MHWLIPISVALTLSACTTQHLPVVHEPYHPLAPESGLHSEFLSESVRLTRKMNGGATALTAGESLRLLQLHTVETRQLKESAPRYQVLKSQSAELENNTVELRRSVDQLRTELAQAVREARSDEKDSTVFDDAGVRSRYYEIARLWNQDENEGAFAKSEIAMKDEALRDKVTDGQWAKFLNLRFRIALDRGDWVSAEQSFNELKDLENCSELSSESALVLALHWFVEGQSEKSYALWSEQCDPDESVYGIARRNYWLARFLEKKDPQKARELFLPIAASRLPSYYGVLAHQRLGAKIEPALRQKTKLYLNAPVEVKTRVHELFAQSEAWLADRLRRESQLALRRAALILEDDDSPQSTQALLYTAHLHQASGSALDAMRIYSKVVDRLGRNPEMLALVGYEFLEEMFPRPHSNLVDAFTRHWGVDPDFAYAIIRQESAFNPAAVSPANARGWMQMMPFLAEQISGEWGFSQYYQPDYLFLAPENLKLASYHLFKLQKILPHPHLVAASYNAGVRRVAKWWKQRYLAPADVFVELIPITETRNYVKLVTRNFIAYKLQKLEPGESLDPNTIPPELPGITSTL
jgi:hypothetical protein